MMSRLVPAFVFLLFLLPSASQARLLTHQDGIMEPVSLMKDVEIFCTKDKEISVGDLLRPEYSSAFTKSEGLISRGYTRDVCWIRFSVRRENESASKWYLRIGPSYISNITLFQSHADKRHELQDLKLSTGNQIPFSSRPIPERLLTFPIEIPEGQPSTFHVKVDTTSALRIESLDLVAEAGLLRVTQRELFGYGLAFGIVILGIISNLAASVQLRENMYLHYTAYLTCLLFLNASISGLASEWIFPEDPGIMDRAVPISVHLVLLSGMSFFNIAFRLKESFRKFFSVYIPIVYAVNFSAITIAIMGQYSYIAKYIQIGSLATVFIIIIGCFRVALREKSGIWLYVIAFIPQLVVAAITFGRNVSLYDVPLAMDQMTLWATAIHVAILNFSVSRLAVKAKEEKNKLETEIMRMATQHEALERQHKFVAMIAHEFRTPLTIIDLSAQRIARKLANSDSETVDRCTNIRTTVTRAIRLMEDFLTTDAALAKLQKIDFHKISVTEILHSVLSDFMGQKVTLSANLESKSILGNSKLMQIAVTNLVRNALQYDLQGKGVAISAYVSEPNLITIDVIDEGPGIHEDEQERIFEKYARGRNSKSISGLGLGLHLASEIIKFHHGTIRVKSKIGQGSTFSIKIPASN